MRPRLRQTETDNRADGASARAYCRAVLPRVSRTFALNIRVLPGELRDAVLQAYLFCRIADTAEDSAHVPADDKPRRLAEYARLFPLAPEWEADVRAWARHFAGLGEHGDDHELCQHAEAVFRAFSETPASLRTPVEECVQEMALGMRDFAARRAASPRGLLQLEDVDDLERYCHVVAGTVGLMLVRLFATTSAHIDAAREREMRDLAERFGLALQLTNIIKDVADDTHRGACYVPRQLAARHRLAPEALLDPHHRSQARAVVRDLATRAAQALDAAVQFTLVIPRREARMRLFCLWPIFLGLRTLVRVLQDERVFVPGARPRITRREVRRCLGESSMAVLSNSAIRRLYGRHRVALDAGLLAF
jgi:farnesyl-diphosphate farnesyltransferase